MAVLDASDVVCSRSRTEKERTDLCYLGFSLWVCFPLIFLGQILCAIATTADPTLQGLLEVAVLAVLLAPPWGLGPALVAEVAGRFRACPTTAWPWFGCRCGERKFRAGLILRAKWLHTFPDIFVAQLTTSRRTSHTQLADKQYNGQQSWPKAGAPDAPEK